MRALLDLVRGSFSGAVLGLVLVAGYWSVAGSPNAFAQDTNVYVSRGVSSACSDWQYDTDPYPNRPGVTFQDFWSGDASYWNLPTAHHCWHNDESSPTWRAIDYPGTGTVQYRATVLVSNVATIQEFRTTASCSGVDVLIWNYSGSLSGTMHYWHVVIAAEVDGSSWTNQFWVPDNSYNYRDLGTVTTSGGCTTTGAHVHQAVYESGGANAYREQTGSAGDGYMYYFW